METLTDSNSDAKAGKRFRLTVKSAEEAVRVIRDKLGENARVLSVRQVGCEGLKKFISSPKLEVIAEIPSNSGSVENDKLENGLSSPTLDENGVSSVSVPSVSSAKSEVSVPLPDETDETPDESESDSFKILAKTGFDQQLLNDIQ